MHKRAFCPQRKGGCLLQVYEQITPKEHEEEQQAAAAPKPVRRGGGWTLFQAAVCLLLLLAALVLRTVAPALYAEARGWYDREMDRSILITDDDVSNS